MPLKHTTETLLVFLLGAALALTGIIIPTLAELPVGIVPWAIAFVVAVIYPLSLSRLFRVNRADYAFRLIHWAPAVLLLLWLGLQGLSLALPGAGSALRWYTWGWTLPGVAVGFFLLAFFCLRVIRRWLQRLALLMIAFVPFLAGAVAAEYYGWNKEIAAVLWQGEWWQIDAGSMLARLSPEDGASVSSEKNLGMSSDPVEESYRERLRAIETRRERIAERLDDRRKSESSLAAAMEGLEDADDVMAMNSSSSDPAFDLRQASSMPTKLPSSGFGWSGILLTLLGAYCAAVHARTRERAAVLA